MREAAVRAQLQRYVSPRLADMALGNPALLDQPGDWREATVLFADIRGYTRLIETTPGPDRHPAPRPLPHRDDRGDLPPPGTVEQLIGDEIVVLFGLAEAAADAPARAVRAAIDMVAAVRAPGPPLGRRRRAPLRHRRGHRLRPGAGRHHRLGGAARAGRGGPAHDRGGAHPAHDTPVRRAYNRRRGHVPRGSDLVRYRELGSPRLKGLKERETLYEILGPRDAAAAARVAPRLALPARPTAPRWARTDRGEDTSGASRQPSSSSTTSRACSTRSRPSSPRSSASCARAAARRRWSSCPAPTSRSSSPTTACRA